MTQAPRAGKVTMARYVPKLSAFANDVAWHLEGLGQAVLDVLTVTVLMLAVHASGVEDGPVARASAPAMNHASNLCVVDCITATVLHRQDS